MKHILNFQKVSAVALVASIFLLFTNTTYLEVQYSLMERAFVGLSMVLAWALFFRTKNTLFIPIPLFLLVIVMGLSISQFLQAYIAEDFLGMVAVALTAILIASLIEINQITLGVTLGGFLLSAWVILTMIFLESAWTQDGKLLGPFTHWNVLGLTLIFCIPAIISIFFNKRNIYIYLFSGLTLAMVMTLIFLSESRTSWISLFCILILTFNIWGYKHKPLLGVSISSVIVGMMIIFFTFKEALLGFLGKGDNFSGRTEIWDSLLSHIADKPLLGNGWARVFPPDSGIFMQVWKETGFQAFHSHNDIIHWYITTGLLGLVCWLILVVLLWVGGIKLLNQNQYFPILVAIALVISGISEITSFTSAGWFMLVLAVTYSATDTTSTTGLRSKFVFQMHFLPYGK